MNTKRKYPLFIIDTSRSHGRGSETDYISCTSNELPFVAAVTLHGRKEYAELYTPADATAIWSDERNGIRIRIKISSELPANYDKAALMSLLRRALKEVLIRKTTQTVNIDNVTNENVIAWCNAFRQQITENLRNTSEDKMQKMHLSVLNKIIKDYEQQI